MLPCETITSLSPFGPLLVPLVPLTPPGMPEIWFPRRFAGRLSGIVFLVKFVLAVASGALDPAVVMRLILGLLNTGETGTVSGGFFILGTPRSPALVNTFGSSGRALNPTFRPARSDSRSLIVRTL